ncbi:MAG: tetratricopeptide repeat protein [Crocinitomicaceae bacterium]|nr:tetratricopeptide repeat protein [Crocinitomicaceae bacterium]
MQNIFRIFIGILLTLNCFGQGKSYFLLDKEVDTNTMSDNDRMVVRESLKAYHKAKDPIEKIRHISEMIDQLFDERYWVDYSDYMFNLVQTEMKKETDPERKKELEFYLGHCYLNKGFYTDIIGNYNDSRVLYEKALKIYKKLDKTHDVSVCINNIGFTYKEEGNLDSALYYFKEALNWERGNEVEYGVQYNNIGYVYDQKGDILKAYEYYNKAREIQEKYPRYKNDLSTTLNNLANVLAEMGDTVKCLELIDRCIAIREEVGDDIGISAAYLNKSVFLNASGRTEEAIELNRKSMAISKKIGNYLNFGEAVTEYALLMDHTDQLDSSIYYLNLVLNDSAYYDYPAIMTDAYAQTAVYYMRINQIEQALKYGNKSLALAIQSENREDESTANEILFKIYDKRGDAKNALKHLLRYHELIDRTQNTKNQQQILRKEYQKQLLLQKEKDSLNASLLQEQSDKEMLEKDLEISKSRNQIFYLSGAGLFALVVILLLFRNNRQKQRDKEVILNQKEEISIERDKAHENYLIAEENRIQLEERNRDIMDSIKYAKRLQEAVLPPQKLVKEWLTNSFILYKPKEIVSGDFYWMETANFKVDDKQSCITFFAAADCTGHGVPGAMVSVICAGALNRAVNEYQLSDVGEILNKVSELVVESFQKSDHKVLDGMDIALCGLDIGRKILYFTGANNPLWIISPNEKLNTESDFHSYSLEHVPNRFLHEIKGVKKHIGLNDSNEEFKSNTIHLQPGDGIFVFSDGLADQFGGKRGKKFKYQQFREILLENFDKDMSEQRELIDQKFESWKGELEQVDDICVIGVKINGKERNNFTNRELEVLEFLLEGLPSKLIADKMNISVHTVDTYRRRLLSKTNTYNTTELINYCKEKEII